MRQYSTNLTDKQWQVTEKHRLKKMLADGWYKGRKLVDYVRQKLWAEFKVVLRPDESSKKFAVLPLRWIVEGSFS